MLTFYSLNLIIEVTKTSRRTNYMKKTLAAFVVSLSVLGAFSARADDLSDCLNASNSLDSGYAKCYLDQAKRDMLRVNQYYKELADNRAFVKWNNGNKMFKGNFKDLLDAWVNYRNKYCSLYSEVYSQYDGSDVYFHQSKCLMDQTKLHADNLHDLIFTAASTIEGGNNTD